MWGQLQPACSTIRWRKRTWSQKLYKERCAEDSKIQGYVSIACSAQNAEHRQTQTQVDHYRLGLDKDSSIDWSIRWDESTVDIYIYIYIYNFSASNLLLFGQQTAGQATLCSVACFGFTGKTAGMMSTKFTLLSVVLMSPFFLMVTICDTYFGGVLTQIGPYTRWRSTPQPTYVWIHLAEWGEWEEHKRNWPYPC